MLEIGDIIDNRYRILEVIGRGGMGVVYLAINDRANKRWAIKEVCRENGDCGNAVQRSLLTELNILRQLRSPHLPSIVDVIDEKESFLIVMDYIEGQTLSQCLKKGVRIPQTEIIDWGIQLCEVLDYLHGQRMPIVYGDLKPSNIIIQSDGTLVLVDFGAARVYNTCIHTEGISFGTVGYAAPEQYAEQGVVDARTDIYALGATLYHLYTGQLLTSQVCMKGYGLNSIINRCVRKCPNDRYQSIRDMKRDLELLRVSGDAALRRRQHRLRIFSLSFGVIAVLVLSVFVIQGILTLITSDMYDDHIRRARMNSDDKVCEEEYLYAIALDSSRIDAYMGLLELYLSDGYYEYSVLVDDTCGDKTESQKMEEQMIRFNGSEYDRAELMYGLGIAMYYYADGIGNKPRSYRYFNIAVGEDGKGGMDSARQDDASKRKRAVCLRNIAGYYEQLYSYGRTGDEKTSFRQYWEDMTAIIQDNIATEDNYKTALLVYKEFLTSVRDSVLYFRDANITKEEIVSQIALIEQHMEADLPSVIERVCEMNPVMRVYITEEVQLVKNIRLQTVEQVNMAYGE